MKANFSLTIAGASLQGLDLVWTFRSLVIHRARVYWVNNPLIDADPERAVRELNDPEINHLLDVAKELDSKIRATTSVPESRRT